MPGLTRPNWVIPMVDPFTGRATIEMQNILNDLFNEPDRLDRAAAVNAQDLRAVQVFSEAVAEENEALIIRVSQVEQLAQSQQSMIVTQQQEIDQLRANLDQLRSDVDGFHP